MGGTKSSKLCFLKKKENPKKGQRDGEGRQVNQKRMRSLPNNRRSDAFQILHFKAGKMIVLFHSSSSACNSQAEMKILCFQARSRCCVFKAACSAPSSHVTVLYFLCHLKIFF